jgi:DNA-binding FadR family transcriptional regulator
MVSAPRRVESLSAQLVRNLRAEIETGRWPVGSRIPSEHELVKQLGVSRATLREALHSLVHLGLLEPKVGDGTYVRSASELDSALMRRVTSAGHHDVFELRAILEEYAAGRAALRRTQDDIDGLRHLAALAMHAMETGDMAQIADVDADFHRAVVDASRNLLLAEVYAALGKALADTVGSLRWDAAVAAEHTRLHGLLIDAIEAGDETGARVLAAQIVRDAQSHANQTRPTS